MKKPNTPIISYRHSANGHKSRWTRMPFCIDAFYFIIGEAVGNIKACSKLGVRASTDVNISNLDFDGFSVGTNKDGMIEIVMFYFEYDTPECQELLSQIKGFLPKGTTVRLLSAYNPERVLPLN